MLPLLPLATLAASAATGCDAEGGFKYDLNASFPGSRFYNTDPGVVKFVASTVGDGSLLDVGAGTGGYCVAFKKIGARVRYTGVDGAINVGEYTRLRSPEPEACEIAHTNICSGGGNRREDKRVMPKADWVMSLEVGEHLPSWCLGRFLRLLHAHNRKGIILSWAVEGQKGKCHINNRRNEPIVRALGALGYVLSEQTQRARHEAKLGHLKKTLMVFDFVPRAERTVAPPTTVTLHGDIGAGEAEGGSVEGHLACRNQTIKEFHMRGEIWTASWCAGGSEI